MATAPKTIIKHIIAVLDLARRVSDLIVQAKAIVKEMTGNSNFPSPVPALATVTQHIDTLVTKETAAQTKAAGTVQARDAAKAIVINDLRALQAYVQGIADATPADAETIILSAGMKVKKQGEINKQDFTVKNNKVSGIVDLTAKGVRGRSAHEWRKSSDGVTFDYVDTTLDATTQVSNLQPGSRCYFRHRVILKDGPTDWSQTVSIIVT